MSLAQWLVSPFLDYGFMRRALAGASALSLGAAPLGVFLVLRRMSLMGDAMSHAILPGVAAGFLLSGLSLGAMMLGGIATGLAVALLAGLVARLTPLREDASFAAFYLISLGLGVLLVSLRGSNMDLLHVLFGTVLGLDDAALLLVTITASVTLLVLAAIYRLLVAECLDPGFLRASGGGGGWVHMGFLVLVVVNLVAGFQVLGTLMVVGIMMLPAAAARFWARSAAWQIPLAAAFGVLASASGLLVSYHYDVPASPSIILAAGACYLFSIVGGPHGGLLRAPRRVARARLH
ncbi:metal ABC transporter permease [Achromobacter sp. UMC46]|uniref:metal ABC transporter permease n=1 Tax=Achromobacter sp. UMC46 TaxID=1862319 RepID=UPI00160217DD|nr:metal ABC transporter permease [Achromobacter sp. UMC46]MBB1598214.1 zinc ABC transporter permease [Achromobacter sp. UMC46]